MKRQAVFLIALSMLIFMIGCGNTQAQRVEYEKAPDFELKDINGATFRLSDYSGKVIILNFFATWCRPCLIEMPDFNEIEREYKNEIKVIAINVGRENPGRVRDFAESKKLKFTIAMDNGTVSRIYGPIRAIPVTVIIDKNFRIAKRYIGLRSKKVFVNDIKNLR